MTIINTEPRSIDVTGNERNVPGVNMSFRRTISPVMNGETLAVSDVIALKKLSYQQVPDLFLRSFGNDATLVLDFTLGAYDRNGHTVQTDIDGNPVLFPAGILASAYFALSVDFAAQITDPLALNQEDPRRAVINIKEGIAETVAGAIIENPGQQVMLCAVVKAIPTGSLEICINGNLRSY